MVHTNDVEHAAINAFVNLSGKKVLEVGCGDGRLSSFLSRKAKSLIAIDPDVRRIETARQAVKGVDFQTGSGEALTFPKDSFDLVFFGFSLHHQDGSTALAEANRVLRTGGDILIIEPTVMSEYTQLVAIFEKEEPALLENAQKAIELFSTPISRQEVFVVPHYFDTKDLFLNHYITSYGNGTAVDEDRQGLLRIIGNKRFSTPICVKDECLIMLISDLHHGKRRTNGSASF